MKKRNKVRRYDSAGRKQQADASREALIEVARREFLARGYAATTIAMLASKAGVSVETIYKSFGGKPGLVRAIYQRGLAGRGAVSAPRRSDEASANASDARSIIRTWGKLAAEVSPLVAPILLLVRAASATDSALTALLRDSDAERLRRMRHNARVLAKRGFLRKSVTVNEAADVMWASVAPEIYELLVVRRGWTAERFGEHVAHTLITALLPP